MFFDIPLIWAYQHLLVSMYGLNNDYTVYNYRLLNEYSVLGPSSLVGI